MKADGFQLISAAPSEGRFDFSLVSSCQAERPSSKHLEIRGKRKIPGVSRSFFVVRLRHLFQNAQKIEINGRIWVFLARLRLQRQRRFFQNAQKIETNGKIWAFLAFRGLRDSAASF